MADMHPVAEKMRFLKPTTEIWMKIDPYYQRQKCTPMTLLSSDIRFMTDIRGPAGVPWGGASNDSRVVNNSNLQHFRWLFLGTFKDEASILYSDTQSLVGFSVIPPKMHDLE